MSTVQQVREILEKAGVKISMADGGKVLVVDDFGIRFTQRARGLFVLRQRGHDMDNEEYAVTDKVPKKVFDDYMRLILVMQRLHEATDSENIAYRIRTWYDGEEKVRQLAIGVFAAVSAQEVAYELLNGEDVEELKKADRHLMRTMENRKNFVAHIGTVFYRAEKMKQHGFEIPAYPQWWNHDWDDKHELSIRISGNIWESSSADCVEYEQQGYSDPFELWDGLPLFGMPKNWSMKVAAIKNYVTQDVPNIPPFSKGFEPELNNITIYAWIERD